MEQTDKPPVRVVVARTGGIAGTRREWTATPEEPQAPHWASLIRACPWDDVPGTDPHSADRFVWRIDAWVDESAHNALVPEAHLTGPWRALVAEVQAFGADRGAG